MAYHYKLVVLLYIACAVISNIAVQYDETLYIYDFKVVDPALLSSINVNYIQNLLWMKLLHAIPTIHVRFRTLSFR